MACLCTSGARSPEGSRSCSSPRLAHPTWRRPFAQVRIHDNASATLCDRPTSDTCVGVGQQGGRSKSFGGFVTLESLHASSPGWHGSRTSNAMMATTCRPKSGCSDVREYELQIPANELTEFVVSKDMCRGQRVKGFLYKVELRWDPARSQALSPRQRLSVSRRLENRLSATGRLVVTSSFNKSWARSHSEAHQRLRALLSAQATKACSAREQDKRTRSH